MRNTFSLAILFLFTMLVIGCREKVNEKGELFVSLMFNHTFYQLSGWEATPILTVDFGKYSINNSIGRKSTEEQLEFLKGSVSGKAYFPVLNANTDKIMAISYMFGEKGSTGRQYFKLKYKNKIFHTKKIIDDVSVFQERNFICSSSYPIGHEVLYENYLVDIILPWRYLGNKKEIDIDPIGKISGQDNPIILLMKLKG